MITGAARGIGAIARSACTQPATRSWRRHATPAPSPRASVGAVEEASATDVRRIYETNVFGLLNVTRAVLVQMHRQRSGHIGKHLLARRVSRRGGFGVYSSTKFAVEGLSEALRDEVAPLGRPRS